MLLAGAAGSLADVEEPLNSALIQVPIFEKNSVIAVMILSRNSPPTPQLRKPSRGAVTVCRAESASCPAARPAISVARCLSVLVSTVMPAVVGSNWTTPCSAFTITKWWSTKCEDCVTIPLVFEDNLPLNKAKLSHNCHTIRRCNRV